jgi:hypothetical protein
VTQLAGLAVRGLVCALALLRAVPCAAQQPATFAVDTVAAIDQTVDGSGSFTTGITLDAVASVALGRGFEGIVRPLAQRLNSGEWNRQIWVATLRYQRSGSIGLRVDGGLIPSPIGLGNLMLRPHLNPTISLPSALFSPLPPLELPSMRATLLGAVYPYGASATVSGTHWDARAAVIDTSPLRTRRVFAEYDQNPPRFPTFVVGGGVTPIVGVRVGASVTQTGWQKAGESPSVTVDRDATIVTIETEVSFRYTRLLGEWVRDSIETATGREAASGWWLQGQQTLTPRWFAAGRVERIQAPLVTPFTGRAEQRLSSVEETLGFRVTRELTLRLSHRARRSFGRPGYDNQVGVSAVWWRRWI